MIFWSSISIRRSSPSGNGAAMTAFMATPKWKRCIMQKIHHAELVVSSIPNQIPKWHRSLSQDYGKDWSIRAEQIERLKRRDEVLP
jgi:hypothetical protein